MSTVSGRARAAVVVAAFSALLATFLPAPAAAADTLMSATEVVNIRSGPATTAKIIGGLKPGQTVTAVSTTPGWTKIKFSRGIAFVASRYLVPAAIKGPVATPPVVLRSTTTEVNLRKGPGLAYGVITILRKGTQVRLTGKVSVGFSEVIAGSSQGWVSTQYLSGTTSGLPAIIGTRVTTADLNVRVSSAANARIVGLVKKGQSVSITGTTQNGRAQIVWNKAIRWVSAQYLANGVSTGPIVPGLPTVVGTRYATTSLLIRSTYANTFTTIAEVPKGTALSITGVVRNARAQVVYAGAARWVTAKYLATTPPAIGGNPYAVERGLKPNAIKLHRASMVRFPQIVTYYGVRRDSIPDHPSGRALDLMIPNYKAASGRALGKAVATWARANARTIGIEYVIWDQHIWNIRRDKEGWRYMAGRGSDSANHKNHVHITVFG